LTLEQIKLLAGREEWVKGKHLAKTGQVRELYRNKLKAEYMIVGNPYHTVSLTAGDVILTDGSHAVNRYTVAALIAASKTGVLRAMALRQRGQASGVLFDAVASVLPRAETLQLEVTLALGREVHLALRTGETRLYVVRNIPEFLGGVRRGDTISFGKNFTYEPHWVGYSTAQKALLSLLDMHCHTLEEAGQPLIGQAARQLKLPSPLASSVLEKLGNMPFRFEKNGEVSLQTGIREQPLPLLFEVSGSEKTLLVTAQLPQQCEMITDEGAYLLVDGEIIKIREEDQALMRTVLRFRSGSRAVFVFGRESVPRVMGELLPALLRAAPATFSEQLQRRMIRLPLRSRVYLDAQGKDIVARVVYAYGDTQVDPFVLKDDVPPLLLRDAAGEKAVMDELAAAGFRVRKGYAFMNDDEGVYRFITEGAALLMEKAEVYFSGAFKKTTARQPKLSGSLRSGNHLLSLDMYDDGQPVEELLPLLEAIRKKKKYFRYKDGTFLSLQGTDDWVPLAEAVVEARSFGAPQGDLGLYRAAYFNALIKEKALPVEADLGAISGAALRTKEVTSPIPGLYAYQQRGFEWVHSLYRLKMGGILADEMGLGKTVQTLAAILCAKHEEKEHRLSIVVTPTSLTYNWLSECRRFAPELKAVVIAGTRAAREAQIEALKKDEVDLVIVSYPIIRQDIDVLSLHDYRFAVLDEAQNIKNPLSVAANAVKKLKGEVRLALSGTPMENNVGELWSLFDFVLPGYLPPFAEFLRRYDEGRNADDLRARIRPFLMRRLKKEVMAELPDKMERTMYAGMTAEQRKVYSAVLLQKRQSVQNILDRLGLRGGRGEVLAAMTELREICCHPRLVMDDYRGESGKLEMLMDILPAILENDHRVLLFSQFTRMLKIIGERLAELGISSLYLDGETPAKERLDMADRFNKGEGSLFLISLKAGGTGLNLTGADTVIHYDPWWNPTTEDQAIDRAHRLGQDKTVQVMRLVTLDSIEEKVVELGSRKRQLFDKLVTPGEVMPEKLKKEDILRLFEH